MQAMHFSSEKKQIGLLQPKTKSGHGYQYPEKRADRVQRIFLALLASPPWTLITAIAESPAGPMWLYICLLKYEASDQREPA